MITNITLENFKCFRHVSINPKLLTVLIGPNGTGKSSVLQALLLLKQSVGEERIQIHGRLFSFSSPAEVSYSFSSESRNPLISIDGQTTVSNSHSDVESKSDHRFHFETVFDPNEPDNFECKGKVDSEIDGISVEIPFPSKENGWRITIDNRYAEFAPLSKFAEFGRPRSSRGGGEFALSVALPLRTPNWQLEKIRFVQAARGFVKPSYPLGNEPSEEISLSDGLSNLEGQLATNLVYGTVIERLSDLMEKVTETGLDTKMIPGRKVEIKSKVNLGSVNIVGEGFGTNALIQLLYQLISAEKRSTVLIEEPEIHLHPKAQAELAEVMAETAKAEDKQIIMTTHSEYVAGRLLTLVAEGKLTTDDLAIYSFEKDEKGECTATEIEVTERGQTKGGLYSFDEATRDEMRRYADGLRKRA